MHQKTQSVLAYGHTRRGDAPTAESRGVDKRPASSITESPVELGPTMGQVVERNNMMQALARVKANKGAPGVDGITVNPEYTHSTTRTQQSRAYRRRWEASIGSPCGCAIR